MREMVFRERQERVAHLDAVGKMIARLYNVDADKAFGAIVGEYAAEVFQETYDVDLLKRKIALRRQAQARVRARRQQDENLIRRLERMGEYGDMKARAVKSVAPPLQKSKNKK
jgi:hypothetical protein